MLQKDVIFSKICDQTFGITNYVKIMKRLENKASIVQDEDFQKLYNGYYGVRRNEAWRKKYYLLFQECRENKHNLTFEYILSKLHSEIGQIEASFASKMLASLNPNFPVWDRRVLNYFKIYNDINLEIIGKTSEERISSAIKIYDIIIEKYQEKEQQAFVKLFDEFFPNCLYDISDTKKIDCFTWLLG